MKVIQVIPNLCMGGAETMCEALTLELVKNGIEVVIVSLYNYQTPITERLIQSGVRIAFLDKKRGLDLLIIKKLSSLFKKEKPDVIHTHLYATTYAIPAAVLAGVRKRIHTVHNVAQKENYGLGKILNKCFFKIFHLVPVALSSIVQESIAKEYRLKKERIPVISNGIDLNKCLPKTNYAIVDKTFKILHIGRFMEQKNHKGLIEAFSIFHLKHPNSRLQLIGDGEKRNDIEKMVEALDLNNAVDFLGLQDNVYSDLHNADIFTLTSLYEGVPITIIEAMGTGLPIVSTSVGGITDMLTDGKNALLTPVDSKKIAEAFLELADSQEKRMLLGKNAKMAAVKFSSEIMAKEYLDIYQKK